MEQTRLWKFFIILIFTMRSITGADSKEIQSSFFLTRLKRARAGFNAHNICRALGCKHGHCDPTEMAQFRFVCKCEKNYTGTFCDELCAKDCGEHGECILGGPSKSEEFCRCEWGYTGPYCRQPQNINILGSSSPDSGNNEVTLVVKETDTINKTSLDVDITITEEDRNRTCLPGFVCQHGLCDEVSLEDSKARCLCETGWTGDFCQHRCDLYCSGSGQCHFDAKKEEKVCLCDVGFSGPNCGKRIRVGFRAGWKFVFFKKLDISLIYSESPPLGDAARWPTGWRWVGKARASCHIMSLMHQSIIESVSGGVDCWTNTCLLDDAYS